LSEIAAALRHCQVCLGQKSRLLAGFGAGEWPLVACGTCGFVYLGRVPGYDALVEEYAWERTSAATRGARRKSMLGRLSAATRWRMKLAHVRDRLRRDRFLAVAGNVLDVGCSGACRVPPGPTPFGIEISRWLADKARPQFEARGGRVINAPAVEGLDAFDDGFFSAIEMRSYLEHESQPRLVLEKCYRKLASGGRVQVRVPNFGSINRRVMGARWCGFRFPDHVNYFTGSSLRRLAEEIGFRYRRINGYSVFGDNLIVELQKP
jgi:hypothetical protein